MLLTGNFALKKPEGTDPVDVQDFNDNADIIDAELKNRPTVDGRASSMTVEFVQATQLTELESGDSLRGLFGKLKLCVKEVIQLIPQMTDLKKSVADGKASVASAITGQGVTTAVDAAFATMAANITAAGNARYNAGVAAADARPNSASTNYKTGYNNGYGEGVAAADARANPSSTNYKTGYNNGYSAGNSAGYNSGYSAGYTAGQSSATVSTKTVSTNVGIWGHGNAYANLETGFTSFYGATAVTLSDTANFRIIGVAASGTTLSVHVENITGSQTIINCTVSATVWGK